MKNIEKNEVEIYKLIADTPLHNAIKDNIEAQKQLAGILKEVYEQNEDPIGTDCQCDMGSEYHHHPECLDNPFIKSLLAQERKIIIKRLEKLSNNLETTDIRYILSALKE